MKFSVTYQARGVYKKEVQKSQTLFVRASLTNPKSPDNGHLSVCSQNFKWHLMYHLTLLPQEENRSCPVVVRATILLQLLFSPSPTTCRPVSFSKR